MSWNNEDNKRYRGPIDRAFISMTETYEVRDFITAYLARRNALNTEQNRKIVFENMGRFAGRAPVKRVDMTAFLDRQLTVTA